LNVDLQRQQDQNQQLPNNSSAIFSSTFAGASHGRRANIYCLHSKQHQQQQK
jgi:hypothetical protein